MSVYEPLEDTQQLGIFKRNLSKIVANNAVRERITGCML